MEERKQKKISLSTFFLIIAIIVIIIMTFIMYKLYQDKESANNKVQELNIQLNTLENEINNLQETKNNVSNTINTSTKNNSTNSTNNNSSSTTISKTFSDEEIKNTLQNYLDLKDALAGSPEGLLVKIGLTNFGTNTERVDDNYIKTNILYSDYKKQMLNYMTNQCFEDNFTDFFKNVNGYLYYWGGGATGTETEVDGIVLKGDYSNLSYIATVNNIHVDGNKEQTNIEFHIQNDNGKCIISYCD